MSKLSVLAVALLALSGILSSPTKSTKFFWYPKDDGSGVVPAYLESDPATRASIKAPYDDVHFQLFTQRTQNFAHELIIGNHNSLVGSAFDMAAPVKILAHGFSSSLTGGFFGSTKNAYLNSKNVNVIGVDWSKLAAAPWYDIAAGHTRVTGEKTAELIEWLVSEGVPLSNIHVLGHSLGAHVAGFAGASMGGRLPRITALDPALPLFGAEDDSGRIDPTDAVFVDVIHTAGGGLLEGGLAFREPRGHSDFYPNEGEHQPGCGADAFGTCSHSRAYEYLQESIANERGFRACKCFDWNHFLGACDCSETDFMGEIARSSSARGLFYLHTHGTSPFAQG